MSEDRTHYEATDGAETPGSLVAELQQIASEAAFESWPYIYCAKIAEKHEQRWQADRARWQAREERLRKLASMLQGIGIMVSQYEIGTRILSILAEETDQ